MKRVLIAATALALIWVTGSIAKADAYDPLKLNCTGCAQSTGSFIPAPGNITGLSVLADPSNSGDLQLKILIPSLDGSNFTFTASGTSSGSFVLHSGVFTSGNNGVNNPSLEVDFLGETLAGGAPPNRLNTFLDQTNPLINPDATGYFVFLFDAGQVSLPNQGASPVNINIGGTLPTGAWVLGDLFTASGVVTTATSEALLVPGPILGAGLIPWLLGGTGLGLFGLNRRRRNRLAA